ncbi:fumarylacetoacetate hydrolase family protein [Pseudobdellovibrio exovorus]|uniref:Fumarylacetoacetate hydrolase family protein n=1 Tax=Pseudobdellovibrio exovorus JSS TaxID=1184267 RepID=M4V8A0_9BACT|nr:fumarylacetoacetate hydrolase family protein [Pseudobdellovibrio exovorus]AGH94675.1 fumarylacetoacetate hydrolase family protein [Pseudobdellovibrio exovorus JSS]
MKLGSLKSTKSLDGKLIVFSKDLKSYAKASHICPSLREAVENWTQVQPQLESLYSQLNTAGFSAAIPATDENVFHSALPRTWLFADGSAFIHHIKLVRQARNAPLPETLLTVPLMYQAESGRFLSPTENIPQVDFTHGTDFEAEVGVIVDHVPMGVTPDQALKHIKLVVLINDVSLRGLIPAELAQGFGFFQSKPNKALSPVAVTVDELAGDWKDGRVHLPLLVKHNSEFFGKANAGEMHFHFGQLIAHAAKTRDLAAGSLIGSGTVANEDPTVGSSCLAEKRMIEQIKNGSPTTPFMKDGDTIEIQMNNTKGENIFGRIYQKVIKA